MWEKVGSFSNMKSYLYFATAVIFLVIRIVNVKKFTKGCPSLDDDGFQFGPWLCALAPKINHKKIGFQQSRSRDDDFDDCTATRDDEFDKHSSG